jgi:hypothetical protein
MYVKIEPSGCCERKGLVQVRLAMYLGSKDYGYDRCYVTVPVFPEKGYTGKVNEMGQPADMDDYKKWVGGLPTQKVLTPFHNHFIYVESSATEKEIMDLAEAYLEEAYIKWASDEKIDCVNYGVTFKAQVTETQKAACLSAVDTIKAIKAERSA